MPQIKCIIISIIKRCESFSHNILYSTKIRKYALFFSYTHRLLTLEDSELHVPPGGRLNELAMGVKVRQTGADPA